MVPLALINLTNRIEPNWDLTIVKVYLGVSFRGAPCLTACSREDMPLYRRYQPYQPDRPPSKLRLKPNSPRHFPSSVGETLLRTASVSIDHALSYYQVIMLMDIFQYSNMYTLRKSIQWLAGEEHIIKECGPYVTKPGTCIYRTPRTRSDIAQAG